MKSANQPSKKAIYSHKPMPSIIIPQPAFQSERVQHKANNAQKENYLNYSNSATGGIGLSFIHPSNTSGNVTIN